MDKTAQNRYYFRSKSVQEGKVIENLLVFRSKSVHFLSKDAFSPSFPEQIRSIEALAVARKGEQVCFFRSISVHSFRIFCILCTANSINHSTYMAGKIKDMSLIKQVIQLKQLGESNRGISRKLSINKETVNNYVKIIQLNNWMYEELLGKEDPVYRNKTSYIKTVYEPKPPKILFSKSKFVWDLLVLLFPALKRYKK